MMNLYMNEMMDNAACTVRLNVSDLVEVELDMIPEEDTAACDQRERAAAKARAKLMVLVDRYSILLDTCALLSRNFLLLLEHLLPLLRDAGKPLLVPYCVVMEMYGLGRNKPELTAHVNEVLHCLLDLKREGMVVICGSRSGGCGERDKVAAVLEMMAQGEVLMVTQDQDLSRSLIEIGRLGLAGGKHVAVGRINGHGYLSRYRMTGSVLVDGVRSDGARVWQRCTCSDCGDEFTIFDKERDYYIANGLALPRRCPTCRKLRNIAAKEYLQTAS